MHLRIRQTGLPGMIRCKRTNLGLLCDGPVSAYGVYMSCILLYLYFCGRQTGESASVCEKQYIVPGGCAGKKNDLNFCMRGGVIFGSSVPGRWLLGATPPFQRVHLLFT